MHKDVFHRCKLCNNIFWFFSGSSRESASVLGWLCQLASFPSTLLTVMVSKLHDFVLQHVLSFVLQVSAMATCCPVSRRWARSCLCAGSWENNSVDLTFYSESPALIAMYFLAWREARVIHVVGSCFSVFAQSSLQVSHFWRFGSWENRLRNAMWHVVSPVPGARGWVALSSDSVPRTVQLGMEGLSHAGADAAVAMGWTNAVDPAQFVRVLGREHMQGSDFDVDILCFSLLGQEGVTLREDFIWDTGVHYIHGLRPGLATVRDDRDRLALPIVNEAHLRLAYEPEHRTISISMDGRQLGPRRIPRRCSNALARARFFVYTESESMSHTQVCALHLSGPFGIGP